MKKDAKYRINTICPSNDMDHALHQKRAPVPTYFRESVVKFTIVLMKLSLTMIARIAFQSLAFSPSSKQIDSNASLTGGGGFPIDLISTRCCFLMDLTAAR